MNFENKHLFMEVLSKSACIIAFKDVAYYCYWAYYVLHTSRYSGFLSVVLTNTEIFLRGLKLSRETGSY